MLWLIYQNKILKRILEQVYSFVNVDVKLLKCHLKKRLNLWLKIKLWYSNNIEVDIMNELINFLTSKEIIVVYMVAGVACFLCFLIYLIDKTYY